MRHDTGPPDYEKNMLPILSDNPQTKLMTNYIFHQMMSSFIIIIVYLHIICLLTIQQKEDSNMKINCLNTDIKVSKIPHE